MAIVPIVATGEPEGQLPGQHGLLRIRRIPAPVYKKVNDAIAGDLATGGADVRASAIGGVVTIRGSAGSATHASRAPGVQQVDLAVELSPASRRDAEIAADVEDKLLVAQGLDPYALSAAGYGEFDPIASNDTPDGQPRTGASRSRCSRTSTSSCRRPSSSEAESVGPSRRRFTRCLLSLALAACSARAKAPSHELPGERHRYLEDQHSRAGNSLDQHRRLEGRSGVPSHIHEARPDLDVATQHDGEYAPVYRLGNQCSTPGSRVAVPMLVDEPSVIAPLRWSPTSLREPRDSREFVRERACRESRTTILHRCDGCWADSA